MKISFNLTKKGILKTILLLLIICFPTFLVASNMGYQVGVKDGTERTLHQIQELLKEKDIVLEWKDVGNGRYEIKIFKKGTFITQISAEIHFNLGHWRLFTDLIGNDLTRALENLGSPWLWKSWYGDINNNGQIDFPNEYSFLLSDETGAGVLTNIGKDWIETSLSSTNTSKAIHMSESNDATDPPLASWTILPSEITSNGLDRQAGTYTSTGTGTWNVTKTKTVTGIQSTQLWGLNWEPTDNSDSNLLAADSGPSQKNCVAGDTLVETWMCQVS